jgi:hypothetical protein
VLVIIYIGPWTSVRGICRTLGPKGEARSIVGLFKCSWLNLGANLAGNCRVRTGGFGVSMRFMGPEEGGVVAVSRTPGPPLWVYLLLGLPCLLLLPLPRMEVKGRKAVGTVAHKEVVSHRAPLLIWDFLAFYIFPCTWKLLPPWLP